MFLRLVTPLGSYTTRKRRVAHGLEIRDALNIHIRRIDILLQVYRIVQVAGVARNSLPSEGCKLKSNMWCNQVAQLPWQLAQIPSL